MNKNIKKYLAFCIGILMPIYGVVMNQSPVKAQESSVDNMEITQHQKLVQNVNWLKLKKYWIELNSLDPNNQNNSRFKKLQNLQSQIKEVKQYIEALETSNLITKEQSNYLKDFIHSRVSYLQFAMGMVLCYKMSQTGVQVVKKRADLEKQYDVLEKMFNEKKIDQKVFDLTKDKIIEDLKFIDENTSINSEAVNVEGITDLLILLNK